MRRTRSRWPRRRRGFPQEKIAELADDRRGVPVRHCRRTSGGPQPPATSAGWQVARSLFFLNVLTGSVGTKGGTSPNGWNKFIAHGFDVPPGHTEWNELLWPPEYPLSCNEMSILLPHFLNEEQGSARGLLLACLQPDLDQPGRLHLDGGADLEGAGRLPRLA